MSQRPTGLRYRRGGQASVQSLVDKIPDDGCLLVFNARHRNWRTKAMGLLYVSKISNNIITRDSKDLCDLYITWKV